MLCCNIGIITAKNINRNTEKIIGYKMELQPSNTKLHNWIGRVCCELTVTLRIARFSQNPHVAILTPICTP